MLPLPKTAVKALITNGKTSKIKGFKSKKTGKKFDASLKLENNRLSFNFN
jgi:DNA topoisomerase-3